MIFFCTKNTNPKENIFCGGGVCVGGGEGWGRGRWMGR